MVEMMILMEMMNKRYVLTSFSHSLTLGAVRAFDVSAWLMRSTWGPTSRGSRLDPIGLTPMATPRVTVIVLKVKEEEEEEEEEEAEDTRNDDDIKDKEDDSGGEDEERTRTRTSTRRRSTFTKLSAHGHDCAERVSGWQEKLVGYPTVPLGEDGVIEALDAQVICIDEENLVAAWQQELSSSDHCLRSPTRQKASPSTPTSSRRRWKMTVTDSRRGC
eukprot:764270-Hanusia_phi.AAC.2